MENLLGKYVLMLCANNDYSWVELVKIRHVKEDKFKVCNDDTWYTTQTIVDIPSTESLKLNFCLNCKIPLKHGNLCNTTHCTNSFAATFNCGFHTTSKESKKFCDRRIKKYPKMRENLWSHETFEENSSMKYDDMLYSVKHGKFLNKSRFADRRLKWTNRGKRYNLHAH